MASYTKKPKKLTPSVQERFEQEAKVANSTKKNPKFYGQKKKQGLAVQAKREEDLRSGRAGLGPATGPTGGAKAKAARVAGPGSASGPQRRTHKAPIKPVSVPKKRRKVGDNYIG